MKSLIVSAWILLVGTALGAPQPPVIAITTFTSAGHLAWTNRFCQPQPVYQILTAGSPAGSWEHLAFVTNQNSVELPIASLAGAPATFFRLAWVDAAPVHFAYVFDEGYGFPAVTGQLTIDLLRRTCGWRFDDVASIDGLHPIGVGLAPLVLADATDGLRVWLNGLVESAYLDGTLQRAPSGEGCVYTSYSGTVYQDGFAGPTPIGTFVAIALE